MIKQKETIVFILLFSCLACLFFKDLLSLRMTFISGDYLQQFFPWSGFYADNIKNFHLPLWTKHVQSGFPLFAEGQVGMLYPLNIFFFYLLPFKVAYNYSFLFHFILAGLFMHLYAKKIGIDTTGAFLASVLLCFGSVYAGSFINVSTLKSLCFFPAVLFLFENYISSEKRHMGNFLLIGAVWGVQLLAGSVQMTFYSIGFCVLYFLFRAHMARRSIFSIPAGIVCAALIALMISLPQLYATFELAQHSNRSGQTLDFALWNSFSPAALTGLVLPSFGAVFTRNNVIYISLLGLFFALASFVNTRKDRMNMLMLGLFTAALLFAFGRYGLLYPIFLRLIKFYSFRAPSKFIYFAVFFLSILSAKGFGSFFSEKTRALSSKAHRSFIAVVAVTGGIFLAVKAIVRFFGPSVLAILKRYVAGNIYGKPFHRFSLDMYMDKVEDAFALLQDKLSFAYPFTFYGAVMMILTVAIIFIVLKYREKRFVKYGCLAFIVLDLLVYSFYFEGPRSSLGRFDDIDIKHPRVYEMLKDDEALYRIYPFGRKENLPGWAYFSSNMAHDIDSIGLYTPLINSDYFFKLKDLGIVDDSIGAVMPKKEIISEKKDLLQELNVKYIVSSEELDHDFLTERVQEKGIYLYEFGGFLPRFRFSPSTGSDDKQEADIRVGEYTSGQAEVSVASDRDGFLIFSEKYYPGWKAYVDGADAEIVKYSDIFMAVKIPQGRHTVIFMYKPSYLKILLPVQAAGFLIVLLWAVNHVRKRTVAS